MAHEPRALLRNLQGAGQFTGRNAVLRVYHEPESWEPLGQGEGAFIENRADFGRELLFTRLAVPNAPGAGLHELAYILRAAMSATDAIGQAHIHEEIVGAVF